MHHRSPPSHLHGDLTRRRLSGGYDKTLKVWELESGREVATLAGHTHYVSACTVTPDGRHVVSASYDQMLRVWELGNGREVATLAGHTHHVTACAVTPDGRHMVSASYDKVLKVWELGSGREVTTLEVHTHHVSACAVTPDGRHVVSASADKTLKVWELGSWWQVATFEGHPHWVSACAVTPDGRHVVSASHDHTLKVWELGSGRPVATLEGHTHQVSACAVTPDGRHVVSASDDETLKVWEMESGREVAALEGHTSAVTACAVTPDGRHVVSASADKTLKVWDLATSTCRVTHLGDAPYLAVAVTASTVIAGDAAGAVWFLDVPSYLASSIDPPLASEPPRALTISTALALASAADSSPKVDVGMVTIRDDECRVAIVGAPAEESVMTREELLSRLSKLLSSQFEQVLYLARIPTEHLPSSTAAQALRAVELMRYIEHQNQLEQLARIVQRVVTGDGHAAPDPR
ncbi:MAG TPA: WD40 repeat domain-containing protein [Kofleriaceae bacterium]|nr:WD40 repeat domain-containing protein [Kofleriaceae bacterium]